MWISMCLDVLQQAKQNVASSWNFNHNNWPGMLKQSLSVVSAWHFPQLQKTEIEKNLLGLDGRCCIKKTTFKIIYMGIFQSATIF